KAEESSIQLHEAVKWGHFNCIKILLQTGTYNVNAIDANGNSALHIAINYLMQSLATSNQSKQFKSYLGIVAILLDFGSDLRLKNTSELTAHNLLVQLYNTLNVRNSGALGLNIKQQYERINNY